MNQQLMKLLENETGDQAKQAKISVTSATVATHQELKEQIGAFSFNSGWVCLPTGLYPCITALSLLLYRKGSSFPQSLQVILQACTSVSQKTAGLLQHLKPAKISIADVLRRIRLNRKRAAGQA